MRMRLVLDSLGQKPAEHREARGVQVVGPEP